MSLQSRFAPVIHGIKQVVSLQKTSATLPLIKSPAPIPQEPSYGFRMEHQINDNEDSVIALKCRKWPKDIWKNFKNKRLGHLDLQQLKGDLIRWSVLTSSLSLVHYYILVFLMLY